MLERARIEYDLRGLSHLVSAIGEALAGRGGSDGDAQRMLKTEAGQLAWDISKSLGPSTKSAGEAGVVRDVKGFLRATPEYSNLESGQQHSTFEDFTWLQAGPSFLLGINNADNRPDASVDEALEIVRAGQKSGSRGKARIELGKRGSQHIYRLNRTRVSKTTFRGVKNKIGERFGTLRASFAFTAAQWVPNKRVAEWIRRHFGSQAHGRAIFREEGLGIPDEPFVEFGSTAPGVGSNPKILEAVQSQTAARKRIMIEKLRKVIAGYCYDWNTGRVFRRREAGEEDV